MNYLFRILSFLLVILTTTVSAQDGIFLGPTKISQIAVPVGTVNAGEYRNGNFVPFRFLTADSSVVTTLPNGLVLLGDTNIMNEKLITKFSLFSNIAKTVGVEFVTTTPDIVIFDTLRVDSVISLNDTIINLADTVTFTNEFGNPDTVFIAADTTILWGDTVLVWNHIIDTAIIERKDIYILEVIFRRAAALVIKEGTLDRPLWALPIVDSIPTGFFLKNIGNASTDYTVKFSRGGDTTSILGFLDPGKSKELIIPPEYSVGGWRADVEIFYTSLRRRFGSEFIENPLERIWIDYSPVILKRGSESLSYYIGTRGVYLLNWKLLSGRDTMLVGRNKTSWAVLDSITPYALVEDTIRIAFQYPLGSEMKDSTILLPIVITPRKYLVPYVEPKWRVRSLWKEVVSGHWEIGWDLNLGGNPQQEGMTSTLEVINLRYQVVKAIEIPVRGSIPVSELLPASSLPEIYAIYIKGQIGSIQMGKLPR